MSLLRTVAIKAPRAPLAATKRVRFSTSPYAQKDSSSAVKDTIESVNKSVGDAAARGIEKGREFIPLPLRPRLRHHSLLLSALACALYGYPLVLDRQRTH